MAFTEFYCDAAAGANVNAGDKTANGVVTSANGAWSTVTNIFTATSGTPFSGVSVGDFASLYADGGTVSVYVARVTAVGGGGLTLTLSTTAKSGTAPTTAGVGITCTTGGAWKGPNAAVNFPFGFISSAQTDSGGDPPRVNLKNGTNYSVTAAVAHTATGGKSVTFQGYTSAVGDGGRFTLDGGTSGASYVLLTLTSGGDALSIAHLYDAIIQNNGATGAADGLSVGGGFVFSVVRNVVVNSIRGDGLVATKAILVECEVYGANQANTAGDGGIKLSGSTDLTRCNAHDNTGSNNSGIICTTTQASYTLSYCIVDTNGQDGIVLPSVNTIATVKSCDTYSNGRDGIRIRNDSFGGAVYIENSNFIKNGGYGINQQSPISTAIIVNCGFGAGTAANTSGQTNGLTGPAAIGSVTYTSNATPWVDPDNGDFRVSLATAKGTGRGTFVETAASYAGTIGYPDIGAAQHLESVGGGSPFPVYKALLYEQTYEDLPY